MSRLWARAPAGEGAALRVRTRAGLPAAIHWRDAWREVERIALTWQLDTQWWGVRIHRDYYKLLAGGMALVIYHDRLRDAWALQRVYD